MIRAHPAASLFPLMSDEELRVLADDIRENGQRVPIVMYKGMVLDGRNRLRACDMLGIPPKVVEWDGQGSPTMYIVSMNLHRRHLNASQRAAVAVEMLPMLEEEARERMRIGGASAAPGRPAEKGVEKIPHLSTGEGRSRDQAARALNVSPRYVSDAKALKNEAPDLYEKVKAGELNIPEAKKQARQRQWREQAERIKAEATPYSLPELHHGDAIEWLRSLPDGCAACCVTDPPYGLDVHRTRGGEREYADGKEYALGLLDAAAKELVRVLSPDAHLYVFSGYTYLAEFKAILARYFDVQDNPIIWVKNRHTMCDFKRWYAPKHEYIIFAKPRGSKRLLNAECSPDVVEFARASGAVHPAEKPVALLRYLIENSTVEGETVIDPFMGIGSAAVAALEAGRRFMGAEIDAGYFAEAVKRLSAAEAA